MSAGEADSEDVLVHDVAQLAQLADGFLAQRGQVNAPRARPEQLTGNDQDLHQLARPSKTDAKAIGYLAIRWAGSSPSQVIAHESEHRQAPASHFRAELRGCFHTAI